MDADIADKRRKMKKRYVASKRHTIQVDYDDYMKGLTRRARGRARARGRGRAGRRRSPVAGLSGRAQTVGPASSGRSSEAASASVRRCAIAWYSGEPIISRNAARLGYSTSRTRSHS